MNDEQNDEICCEGTFAWLVKIAVAVVSSSALNETTIRREDSSITLGRNIKRGRKGTG